MTWEEGDYPSTATGRGFRSRQKNLLLPSYLHLYAYPSLSWLLGYVLRFGNFWIIRKLVTNIFFTLNLLAKAIGILNCSWTVNAFERFPEKILISNWKPEFIILLPWYCFFLLEVWGSPIPLVCMLIALSCCLEKKEVASYQEPLVVWWCVVRQSIAHALWIAPLWLLLSSSFMSALSWRVNLRQVESGICSLWHVVANCIIIDEKGDLKPHWILTGKT